MPQRPVPVEFDEARIDDIFAEVDQSHLPGAAVGIAIGGRPVYRKGFGLATMELPVTLSPTIRMRIGSTTKHFAAFTYLLLCEEGLAGIDDPIGRHVPGLHPVSRDVTARQLMTHTSGLRDALDIVHQLSGTGHRVTSDELLALYGDIDDVNARPGTTWTYINGGYLLLSAAIERIAGQPLEEVMRERVFRRVGMHDTLLRRHDNDFVPNSATLHMTRTSPAYHRAGSGPAGAGFEKQYIGAELAGEGGMVSTVDDLLRWLAHLEAPVVGTEATWSVMRSPQLLANGTSTGYGLGLHLNRYRGVETIFHGGFVMGGNSQLLKVPDAGLDVVVMLNRSDVFATTLTHKILDACLPGLEPVRSRPGGGTVTGVFRSPASGRVIQLFERDGSQIVSTYGMDYPVEPDDEDGALWPAGIWHTVRQATRLVGDPRNPSAIQFDDYGNLDQLERLPAGAGEPHAAAITGYYVSAAVGVEATIVEDDDGVRMATVSRLGSAEFRLESVTDGVWRSRAIAAMPWGGTLTFGADRESFRLSTFRTHDLAFHRQA